MFLYSCIRLTTNSILLQLFQRHKGSEVVFNHRYVGGFQALDKDIVSLSQRSMTKREPLQLLYSFQDSTRIHSGR